MSTVEERVAEVERVEHLRQDAALRRVLRARDAEIDDLRRQLDIVTTIDQARLAPPKWLQPPSATSGHRGTVCLLLTDTHFGEVVNPSEVDGMNAYDDVIAEQRLRRFGDRGIRLARDYVSGLEYDGCVLFLGGDIFTGVIHDELAETNSETVQESLIHWLDPVAALVYQLADAFGRVHIAVTFGNHGRDSRKPRAKKRARHNWEWPFYKVLAREMKSDERITWQIPDSADTHVTVGNTHYLLTHGDQFRGGSGISGALAPLMLGSHRKTRREMAAGRSYDWMVMGHFHQFMRLPSVIVGGCLKGLDEYAYIGNFGSEPASGTFWVNTPERGVMFLERIEVQDREAEGW